MSQPVASSEAGNMFVPTPLRLMLEAVAHVMGLVKHGYHYYLACLAQLPLKPSVL